MILLLSILFLAVAGLGGVSGSTLLTTIADVTYKYQSTYGVTLSSQLINPAYYSTFGNITQFRGVLVSSFEGELDIADGCSLLKPTTPLNYPWVAFVLRGKCRFVEKAENAAKSGACGVVIMDSLDDPLPPVMSADKGKVTSGALSIPSVSVTWDSGHSLLSAIQSSGKVLLDVSPGEVVALTTQESTNSNWFMTHIIIFGTVLLCLSIGVMAMYLYKSRTIATHHVETREEGEELLQKIPTRDYLEKGVTRFENTSCAICLDDFNEGDKLRTLRCEHEFHQACVDPWILNHRNCPLCKGEILLKDYAGNDHNKKKKKGKANKRGGQVAQNSASNQENLSQIDLLPRAVSTSMLSANLQDLSARNPHESYTEVLGDGFHHEEEEEEEASGQHVPEGSRVEERERTRVEGAGPVSPGTILMQSGPIRVYHRPRESTEDTLVISAHHVINFAYAPPRHTHRRTRTPPSTPPPTQEYLDVHTSSEDSEIFISRSSPLNESSSGSEQDALNDSV